MVVGGAVGFFTLYLVLLVSKGGIGGGDVKLMGVVGLVLGWQLVLLAIILATFCGSLYVGILLLFRQSVTKGMLLPFGPFLAIGSLAAYVMGDSLVTWYFSTFLALLP
ncbi:aspartate peptidase [Fictibacillus macauensis ZFHKF-1]|uniref:Aspartate peptidase n=2 Tax=Fictibacillus TaxID=1329200 RepID=I8J0R1_9BACL|nr:aspartate peptidase [Fictibacillus macauensis ZFHKF-1]